MAEHPQLGLAPQDHFAIDWQKRDKFVAEYVRTGDRKQAVQIAGVTLATGTNWLAQKWFKDRVHDVRKSMDKQMEGRITSILDKTFQQLNDRLDNGDPKILKDGTIIRTPMAAQTLTVLAGIMFDKRAILRKNEAPEDNDVMATLDKIGEKLRQFSVTGNPASLREAEITTIEAADNTAEFAEDVPLPSNGNSL